MEMSEKAIRDLKKKLDIEMQRKEIEIVEYWRKEIETIYRKKLENLGALQVEMKGLMDRMQNRIAILTRIVREG